MPTYLFTVAPNLLSAPQKQEVVNRITRIHSEEGGGVPQYLVHVVFNEIPAANRYINKRQVPDQQIWIYGHIRSGRSDDQKTAMVERLMSESSEATGIDQSYIWAYINDLAKAAEFGQVLPAPGENEKEWEESIPREVRERYGIAVSDGNGN